MKAAALALVVLSSTALGQARVGPLFYYPSMRVTRVGSSPLAAGNELVFEIYTGGQTATIDALHFRTGAEYTAGQWSLSLVDQYGAVLASTTQALTASSWQTWTLSPPLSFTTWALIDFHLAPVGNAELDFLNLDSTGVPLGGELTPWIVGALAQTGWVVPMRPGTPRFEPGTLIIETAGADPLAAPGCLDAGVASGWPYAEMEGVHVADGASAEQATAFIVDPTASTPDGIFQVSLQLKNVTATQLEVELRSPGASTVSGTLSRSQGDNWEATLTPPFLPPSLASGVTFSIVLRPTGGSADWVRYTAGAPDAGECDPVARASFSGSQGRAGSRYDSDFAFWYAYCAVSLRYPDLDGDGYPDLHTAVWACGQATAPGPADCDDSNADVHPGALERCNGVDDDCDGLVDGDDPGLQLAACELSAGVCAGRAHLRSACVGGAWLACNGAEYGPAYEATEVTCDGFDNDCDGQIDELSEGPLCANQFGVCEGRHAHACADGGWAACTAADLPETWEPEETRCDGLDNDCDGLVDGEESTLAPVRCELQQGVCADSIHPPQHCVGGQWQPCDVRQYGSNYQPVETRCDGLDNDCDGLIDEGCEAPQPSSCQAFPGGGALGLLALALAGRRRRRLAALSLLALLSGCHDKPPPAPAVRGREIDLGPVMERARLGFHSESNGRWVAGGPLAPSVERDGALGLLPGPMGAPRVRLVTASLGRAASGPAPAAVARSAGGLSVDRGGVREELESAGGNLEQRWRFAARPPGGGELEVRVGVSGAWLRAAEAGALHFESPAASARWRYSDASWVDAAGRRSPVGLRWDEGRSEIVLRVPAAAVASASYPAVLDPTLSPELDTGTPAQVKAPVVLSELRVASDGTDYLAVWADQRGGTYYPSTITATLVTQQGTRLSPLGTQLAGGSGSLTGIGVGYGGGEYLVAWLDSGTALRALRVSTTGQPLDPAPLTLASGATAFGYGHASVAYSSGEFLVAWTGVDSNGNAYIAGARVSSTGQVLDATPLNLISLGVSETLPVVAGSQTGFALAWQHSTNNGIQARVSRVNLAGQVLDPYGVIASTVYLNGELGLASDGTDFLLAWCEYDYTTYSGVLHEAPFTSSGTLGTDRTLPLPNSVSSPRLDYDGSEYVMAWGNYGAGAWTSAALRADAAGVWLDAQPVALSQVGVDSTAVACLAGQCLQTFGDGTAARLATSALAALDTASFPLVTMDGPESGPDVAGSGSQFFVAWQDYVRGRIYGARIALDGGVLDPDGLTLSAGTPMQSDYREALASNGSDFLAVWTNSGGLAGTRVDASGAVLDVPPLSFGTGNSPRVTASATQYFLVWQATSGDLYGSRVAFDGGVLDPGGILLSGAYRPANAWSLASDGDLFFAVWDSYTQGMLGARVAADGGLLDAPPLVIGAGSSPSIVYDGAHFLVATRLGTFFRVAPSGTVLDPQGFQGSPLNGYAQPSGALHPFTFDGLEGIEVLTGTSSTYPSTAQLVLQRISPAGSAVAAGVYDLRDAGNWVGAPAIASVPSGRSLIVYQHIDYAAPFTPSRVYARLYDRTPTGLGTACVVGVDCSSGFCVDGVCCDTACGDGGLDCQACSVATGALTDGTCALRAPGASCRGSLGACDPAEVCDGVSPLCPADVLLDAGTLCRAAYSVCDVPEFCTGSSANCPYDGPAPPGTPCDDGNPCTGPDTCYYWGCNAGPPLDAGTPCDDGDLCSATSACNGAGACTGGGWSSCPAPDDCHSDGYCDPGTAACTNPPLLDGTSCDGGACFQGACLPVPDAGVPDAGVPDAGAPDAGGPDAGPVDAGADAGADAGPADGGVDGGGDWGADAGHPPGDAGQPSDGGGHGHAIHGCGCGAVPAPFGWLAIVAAVLARRARRRGR